MYDLTIDLGDRLDALAEIGEAFGRAGVSIEGGGAFGPVAHFLVADPDAAAAALGPGRITAVRTPLMQRLDQDTPGQVGALTRRMADAGVQIEVLYSDHDGNLILLVDDAEAGARVSAAWTARRS
ncbi:hypothetical protein J2S43_005252 [Catenuloplanes nepalensis]|uniref:Amino acid-binding ACT domain-containing protein n=1 Tax=Catenuloplanes nepalensis TaxID=587533 RepID=A0ABT9MZF2_9ACTN|nr:hypothetical protein [Catenuloplanes nepalensis]MDP9796740.1 hypothetical protein [Catenuloplanes nepalensis]